MDARQLYEALKKIQEPKGYYFNPDMDMTMALMDSLLENKDRYGYMACPCRLANGELKMDQDIVCPCTYREADVKEFGACFCGLYVDEDIRDGKKDVPVVPERRPPENIVF